MKEQLSSTRKLVGIMKSEGVSEDERWNVDSSDVTWNGGEGPHRWVVFRVPPPKTIHINGAVFAYPLKNGWLARMWFRLRVWWAVRRARKSGAVFVETRS